MNRLFFVLFFVLFSLPVSCGADIITLHDGTEIRGDITQVDGQSVRYAIKGENKKVPLNDIMKVTFMKVYQRERERTIEDISEPELKEMLNRIPELSQTYSDAGGICLLDEERYQLHPDGSSTHTVRTVYLILKERGRHKANVSFGYLRERQKGEITWARTICDGQIYDVTDHAVSVEEKYYTYPLYNQYMVKKFSLPQASVRSVIDYQYEINSAAHDLFFPFSGKKYFAAEDPIVISRLIVETPHCIPLSSAIKNDTQSIQYAHETTAQAERYIWTRQSIPGCMKENMQPPEKKIYPFVVFAIQDSWGHIAEAYYERVMALFKNDRPLKAAAQKIIKNTHSLESALNALYLYVVNTITLAPVEPMEYQYLPHDPLSIVHTRVAGYIDKAFLFYAMARSAGFPAEFLLVSPADSDLFVPEVPMLTQLSRAAVYVPPHYFIFPLYAYDSLHTIPKTMQHSQGITIDRHGACISVPHASSAHEGVRILASLILDADGTLHVKEIQHFSGDRESEIRQFKKHSAEDLKKIFEVRLYEKDPHAQLVSLHADALYDIERPLIIRMDYEIKNCGLTAGDAIRALRIPGILYTAEEVGANQRVYPLFWYTKESLTRRAVLHIPDGYQCSWTPPAVSLHDVYTRYRAGYTPRQHAVLFEEQYIRNTTMLPPSAYQRYKSLIESRAQYTQQWLIIDKK